MQPVSCHWSLSIEALTRKCYVKIVFLKIPQNLQENSYPRVSFSIKLQACEKKKDTLAQVFFCEFRKMFENTFLYRTPLSL